MDVEGSGLLGRARRRLGARRKGARNGKSGKMWNVLHVL